MSSNVWGPYDKDIEAVGRGSDEELMLAVKKGDAAAFEELYDRYQQRLFHFIFRYIGEKSGAEDILQETFLRILKGREAYEPKALFSSYIFTIARNLCLDHLKASKRSHELAGQEALVKAAVDPSKGPLKFLETTETSQIVKREIQSLPDGQREVLLLSKYSGLSYEEIARVVESTPGAVKQKAYRAMLHLKGRLKALL